MTDRLQEIFDEWEKEDADEATDALESGKDSYDLAQPATWGDVDAADSGARGVAGEAIESIRIKPPHVEPDADDFGGPSDNDADDAPVFAAKPTTAGVGEASPLTPRGKPTASSGSLDWKQLADQLAMAEAARAQSKGYENLFANVGAQSGYRKNDAAGDVLTATAKQPLDLAKERQGMESRDLSNQSQRQALGVKAAMDDPNSLQSQKAREAIKAALPGVNLPKLDNWSANEIQRYIKTGDFARIQDQQRKGEADAAKRQADAEKKTAESEKLAAMRKNWRKDLMDAGIDPETATLDDVKLVMSKRHALANEKLASAQFGYKAEHDLNEDVKDLGKTLGDDPSRMMGLVEKLESDAGTPDIPGVGPIDNLKPDMVVGKEGLSVRNDMREAVRAMLTMKSGKTVTPQEAQDYAKIYGINGTEDAFRDGIRRLRTDMAQTIAAKKAGFRPEAVKTYESRGGATTPEMPPPAPKKSPTDWVTLRRKNGDTIRATRADAEGFLKTHPEEATIDE